jgi:polygalacturonase
MRKTVRSVQFLLFAAYVSAIYSIAARAAGPSAFFNIADYGAVGNGTKLCTEAIQKAVNACSDAGGGTVYIPAGQFLSGAIFLKSNVTLNVSEGATLLASKNFEHFPPFKPGWRIQSDDTRVTSLITGHDLENVAVTGRGTLDGNGRVWWDAFNKDKNREKDQQRILIHGRPRVINLYRCQDVKIEDVKIINSPSWTVHLIGCDNLVVDGISIINPEEGPNTDGVNPESCRNVRISNCFIDTGDDCITLKSGENEEGRLKARPTENVAITNCVMYKGHGAVVIGSEMSGCVRNVVASNIVCVGTDRAVRIKSTRGRGGVVENIRYNNFIVENVREPIYITSFYTKTDPEPVSERTPIFRDIAISHFTIRNSPYTARIYGLPEMPIQRLCITDVTASTEVGFICDSVEGLELNNVEVNAGKGSPFEISNCNDIELRGIKSTRPKADKPVVKMKNVRDAFVQGCRAFDGTDTFLELAGKSSDKILLTGNDLSAAKNHFILKDDVPKGAVLEK